MSPEKPYASRHFSQPLQEQFARVTHDYNPMHMDAMAARRTQAGAPVVHGMHSLLWALDCLAAKEKGIRRVSELKASFYKWIYVDTTAELVLVSSTDEEIKGQIRVGSTTVTAFTLKLGEALAGSLAGTSDGRGGALLPVSVEPIDVALEAMGTQAGAVEVVGEDFEKLFPSLSREWNPLRVASIAALSRVVGMLCPGLNSIFSGLKLKFGAKEGAGDVLEFKVKSVNERFRSVVLAVEGPGLSGRVETFVRQPPARQTGMRAVAHAVAAGEFAGAHALIVGGSRGLGELTAKLLAAGGARVTITYAVGLEQAMDVAREIEGWGGICDVMHYDATLAADAQLAGMAVPVTHAYYFATGQIFRAKTALFSADVYGEFAKVYVEGFFDLCEALGRRSVEGVSVFYPSSVAVTERPREMTEYAAAKAAGEVLCEDMNRFMRGVRVVQRRLPRLPTDQTLSLVAVPSADPLEVLLPIVREVQAREVAS
ncbi:MAG: SDR family NAD(P)-dependent oxidoreductase [Acidobacteriaceae bacterium]